MQEERSERIVFHICLLLSILSGAAYWLLHGVLRPDEPLEVALFYRFGDYDYLPLIENLARFRYGEIADWATQGEGLFPFPFLSSLPYALGSAALGVWGYPLADTLLSLARFLSFYWIARQILPRRLSAAPAALLAMVALGPYGLSDALTLWSYRLPRPFVTSILALAALATLFAALQKAASDNLRLLLFFAVFTVALAHGDAHGALMLGLCGLAVMLILVFRERRHLKNVLIAGFTLLALALTALPFQLAMKPDISARWGFFSAPAWPPAFVLTPHFLKALAVLAAASLAHLVMTRRGKELPAPYSAALTLLWCLQAAAFLALPLSWLLLSGSIQIDHFVRRQNYAASMTYLLGALFLCRLIPAGWVTVSARLAGMARGIPCALLSALLFLALVQNSKMNFATGTESQPRSYTKLADGEPIWPPDNRYRRALTEVFAELREPRYDGARVMGSFDHELLMWWMAFRQGASYAGKGWLSLLPTETIEQRSVHLARRLGADEAWLKRQLESDYFIGLFLGYGRYVVNERYSLAPLEDYDEDARARILATPVNYSWELAMPESDKTRILGYFAEPLAPDERLDLVVLARIGEFAALTFDDPAFEKTFDNDIFAIWIRRDLQ